MCLYTTNKKAFIAKSDLEVAKYFRNKIDYMSLGYYITPFQQEAVYPNTILKPESPIKFSLIGQNKFGDYIYSIGAGAIHAMIIPTDAKNFSTFALKAIIPKGTKYWVGTTGESICAERLYITNDEFQNIDIIDKGIYKEILSRATEKNGIRIGDYLLNTDDFVHPSEDIICISERVIGIVCGFYNDNSPMICSPYIEKERWNTNEISLFANAEVQNQESGKRATDMYKQGNMWVNSVFDCCTRKGKNWYLGSINENKIRLYNMKYINASCAITGIGHIIDKYQVYHTCDVRIDGARIHTKIIGANNYYTYCDEPFAGGAPMNVVPFYNYKNKYENI